MRQKERQHTLDLVNFGGSPCSIGSRRERRKENHMNGSLHVGLAALGAAIAVGLIGGRASDAVGRNPVASTKILVQSILSIAFAEAIVFYALFLVK
jgi:F-type H+-transporting ATPase subunit c